MVAQAETNCVGNTGQRRHSSGFMCVRIPSMFLAQPSMRSDTIHALRNTFGDDKAVRIIEKWAKANQLFEPEAADQLGLAVTPLFCGSFLERFIMAMEN